MSKKINRKLRAFTLAELLLTLIIIGIISAVALPGLRKNVYSKEFEAGLKKGYSTLQQSWGLVMLKYRNNIAGKIADNAAAVEEFRIVLKATKVCSTDVTTEGCWSTGSRLLNGNPWKPTGHAGLILLDGSILALNYNKLCTSSFLTAKNSCAIAYIDVNGFDKPNVLGRDIFEFYLSTTEVVPSGSELDSRFGTPSMNCTSTGAGNACTAEALINAGVLNNN